MTALIVSAAACSRAGDESKSKRSPAAPPPAAAGIPADLRIEVEVDGVAAPPITRARLVATAPDFSDSDRKAWRLTTLLGASFQRDGAVVEAANDTGIAVSIRSPRTKHHPQPVLFLTRRGVVVVAVVTPDNPFPNYHGQGGRLRRPGDSRPRISSVTRLRVRLDKNRKKKSSPTP